MGARTIAWGRCTPLTIVDQFGIKISSFTPSFEALGHLLNIPIMDDEVPENTEFFNLTLERNGLHERIQLDPVDGLVQITDNDSMCTVVIGTTLTL